MALFSDGPPSTIDDLVAQDSFLLNVATTEGIDVGSKLQSAFNELGIELLAIFGREASIYAPVLGEAPLDTNHLSVTPALQLWHVFKSLELVYRDAYFNQLNDRYKAKWAEFQKIADWNKSKFIDTGAGLVIDPLPLPAAPVLNYQPSTLSGGTVYLAITFVNAEGEESSPTPPTESVIPDQQQLLVNATSWPTNAVNWNVYAGISPVALYLQNTTALVLGEAWACTLPLSQDGQLVGTGQIPNVTRDLPRRIMRG